MATTKKAEKALRAVVICTARRGVFFGYTPISGDDIVKAGKTTIVNARMCTHWSAATLGVLGLAGIGPQKGSRVGPRVPDLAVESITAVMSCSDAAAAAWETGPWS